MKRTASYSRSSMSLKNSLDGGDSPRKCTMKMDDQALQEVYLLEPNYADEVEISDVEAEEEIASYNEDVHAELEAANDDDQSPDFKTKLANLVRSNECSDNFIDNLLNLLRKNGHTELPSDKKTLVAKPQHAAKLSDNIVLSKILENQKIMIKNQMLIMEQMKALARSQATQRIRLAGLTERIDKALPVLPVEEIQEITRKVTSPKLETKLFPMKTLDHFDEFNKNLVDENFKEQVLPDITKAMQNSSWLFLLMNDDVIFQYNLKGIFNKRAFRETNLYKLLEEHYGDHNYLKERHVQALIRQAHARQSTKNSRAKGKLKKMSEKEDFLQESDSYQ
ncbi:uncharacterized protein LOC129802175 [Phlebotomus papatasi]|uniref:uncharacterized protein LOC129802175 n=1 Tax=Phlebotomus papatasi TaxID=29031 RepID=UPI00248417B7|nr:uncharacterized protein LOC129802175 [Phlebotomus papatasi]XP_055703783.1 uncharacterized protein LOC129802175 [Phlebotomus papatasi]